MNGAKKGKSLYLPYKNKLEWIKQKNLITRNLRKKLIYTTTIIESFNSQLRKVIKSKRVLATTGIYEITFLSTKKNIWKCWTYS